jgi:hypothetical protein
MDNLLIVETQYTPSIEMLTAGVVTMKGRSYPENTFEFYKPVISWLKEYLEDRNEAKKLVLNFEIIYFNSSSSKLYFDLFDVLNEHIQHHTVEVNWGYDEENESAQEAGEDFIDDFPDLTINLVVTN